MAVAEGPSRRLSHGFAFLSAAHQGSLFTVPPQQDIKASSPNLTPTLLPWSNTEGPNLSPTRPRT